MFGSRASRWPTIDYYQPGGPSQIKVLSVGELQTLIGIARSNGWSAIGRPGWIEQHIGSIASVRLVIFGPEGDAAYRCIALVVLGDNTGYRFTIDVQRVSFDKFRDITQEELVLLAHRQLSSYPFLPLAPGEEESWENALWDNPDDSNDVNR